MMVATTTEGGDVPARKKRKPAPLVGETREMQMVSRLLADRLDVSLAEFIAYRRLPGDSWLSWEEIGNALAAAVSTAKSDAPLPGWTHESARRWAIRLGIPTDTRPRDGAPLIARYERSLIAKGLRLKDVRHKGQRGPQP
jgi:hypothetical protein